MSNSLFLIKVYGVVDITDRKDWIYPYEEQTFPVEGEMYFHAYSTRASAHRAAKEFAANNGYDKYKVEEYRQFK